MTQRGQKRHVLFFLVAVVVPAVVLLVLGLRMITQERELLEKHLADEQRRLATEVGREVLTRLERLRIRQVSALATQNKAAEDPELVLVGYLDQNQLVLPWDQISAAEESQKLLAEPDFANRIARGESEEIRARQFGKAVESYQQAMNTAHASTQIAYGRLLLARALMKAQKQSEAISHYKSLLALPTGIVDEQGISFSLYAAAQLLDNGLEHPTVIDRLRAELNSNRWLPPAQVYFLRELATKITEGAPDQKTGNAGRELLQEISNRIRNLEQAEELRKDFASLKLEPPASRQPSSSEPAWVAYGKEIWLVTLANELSSSRQVIIVASADQVFAKLDSNGTPDKPTGRYQLTMKDDPKAISLGAGLRGLQLVFAPSDQPRLGPWNLQRSFYFAALVLVLCITSFGAYLLWRDVQREVRVAELRSQFVSSVSHELKTPLTAIRMFAETLRLGRSSNPKMEEEYLDTIINESERLTRLLNNVLDFSKIEQGKKTYQLRPTSLAEVVYSATRALEYPLAQEGFKLNLDLENPMPLIKADADALQQAILNLLTNAMKYSGDGREIDLRLERRNGHAVIQVRDSGLGIAPQEQAKIFQDFYRVITPETKSIPGTGLGLALVSHVANHHRGHVEVQSALGKGSTFSLHLPMEDVR